MNEKWEALLRYDEEIRSFAELLKPFGDEWVAELGRAFFLLEEDRTYLPGIVGRLVKEATSELDRQRQELEREQERLLLKTADGERCSAKSRQILAHAVSQGYSLSVQPSGAFAASKTGKGITYLHSNYDIERFGRHLEND